MNIAAQQEQSRVNIIKLSSFDEVLEESVSTEDAVDMWFALNSQNRALQCEQDLYAALTSRLLEESLTVFVIKSPNEATKADQ